MVIPFARSLTPQTARKANAFKGCDKNERSRCCAPWHRRMTTTGVARLAIIPFLSATRFMMDLIRGSKCCSCFGWECAALIKNLSAFVNDIRPLNDQRIRNIRQFAKLLLRHRHQFGHIAHFIIGIH